MRNEYIFNIFANISLLFMYNNYSVVSIVILFFSYEKLDGVGPVDNKPFTN